MNGRYIFFQKLENRHSDSPRVYPQKKLYLSLYLSTMPWRCMESGGIILCIFSLDGSEWSAPHSSHFTNWKRHITHWIRDWVGQISRLDVTAERNISVQGIKHWSSSPQPITMVTELHRTGVTLVSIGMFLTYNHSESTISKLFLLICIHLILLPITLPNTSQRQYRLSQLQAIWYTPAGRWS
jgi:hypothetical protein